MRNCKGFERKWPWPYFKVLPGIRLEVEENHEKTQIAVLRAKI
jgi:hypothetical protein